MKLVAFFVPFLLFQSFQASQISLETYNDVLVYLSLNHHLAKSIKKSGVGPHYVEQLNNLINTMKDLSSLLFDYRISRRFCQLEPASAPVQKQVLAKYQLDTNNPWAEAVLYQSLDERCFPNIGKQYGSINFFTKNPENLYRFQVLTQRGYPIFRPYLDPTKTETNRRHVFKKCIIREVVRLVIEKTEKDHGIKISNEVNLRALFNVSKITGKYHYFTDTNAIPIFINLPQIILEKK